MNGTYMVLTAYKSVADFDAPPNQAYNDALGDEGRAKLTDLVNKAINNTDDMLLAFDPRMTSPSPGMVAADPGFWKPKPTMAKKEAGAAPAAKKDDKKAEPGKP